MIKTHLKNSSPCRIIETEFNLKHEVYYEKNVVQSRRDHLPDPLCRI